MKRADQAMKILNQVWHPTMIQGETFISGLTDEFETLQDVNRHLFDPAQDWAAIGVVKFGDREFLVRVLAEPVHYAFRLLGSLMICRDGKALIQPIYRSSGQNHPEVRHHWVPTSGIWTAEALAARYRPSADGGPSVGWIGKHYYNFPNRRWTRHDKTAASVKDRLIAEALQVFLRAL